MSYIYCNKNPLSKNVEDCVIRAIATVLDEDWNNVFLGLTIEAYMYKDLINSNLIWGSYLLYLGFERYSLPNTCPLCYTVKDFTIDHPIGRFVLGDGAHAIAVIDGNYYDTFDSGDRTVLFYYERREINGNTESILHTTDQPILSTVSESTSTAKTRTIKSSIC